MTAYTRKLISAELEVIKGRLAGVLDSSASAVLDSCARQVDESKGGKDTWGFKIGLDRPLLFRQTSIKSNKDAKFEMTVDVAGIVRAPSGYDRAKGQSIVVRVWTADKDIYYDEQLDSLELSDRVALFGRGRVIHRFHFDIASGKSEPPWHLHFGGGAREPHELFRFPEQLGLPRFLHHPMGLIQTCEFVLYHFFPSEYSDIARDPSWQHCLHQSEKAYMATYVARVALLSKQWSDKVSYHQHCCSTA